MENLLLDFHVGVDSEQTLLVSQVLSSVPCVLTNSSTTYTDPAVSVQVTTLTRETEKGERVPRGVWQERKVILKYDGSLTRG